MGERRANRVRDKLLRAKGSETVFDTVTGREVEVRLVAADHMPVGRCFLIGRSNPASRRVPAHRKRFRRIAAGASREVREYKGEDWGKIPRCLGR